MSSSFIHIYSKALLSSLCRSRPRPWRYQLPAASQSSFALSIRTTKSKVWVASLGAWLLLIAIVTQTCKVIQRCCSLAARLKAGNFDLKVRALDDADDNHNKRPQWAGSNFHMQLNKARVEIYKGSIDRARFDAASCRYALVQPTTCQELRFALTHSFSQVASTCAALSFLMIGTAISYLPCLSLSQRRYTCPTSKSRCQPPESENGAESSSHESA